MSMAVFSAVCTLTAYALLVVILTAAEQVGADVIHLSYVP